MRFLISSPERITKEVLQFAYLSGMDRVPWLAKVHDDNGCLVLERNVSDSGCLTIPWHVEGHGLIAISTGTLVERDEPYRLPLELARGVLHQVRNHLFDWQSIGLAVPASIPDKVTEAIRQFSWAVTSPDDLAMEEKAQDAIRMALDASRLLSAAYAEQSIAVRRRPTGKLASLLGGELSGPPLEKPLADEFLSAFTTAVVPILWRNVEVSEGNFDWSTCDHHVEWCRQHGLKVCAGPLVQLDAAGLPDWIYLWEDDYDALLSAAGEFVEAAVMRYKGKVDLWQCVARANTSTVLSFSEEENLRLAASVLHLVRSLDVETPRIVSIDQPWGEFLGRRAMDFPPMNFADALVRARLDLKAILLEMNFGCYAGGTLPRSELEISRQLDAWAFLGLPLLVSLSMPSSDCEDDLAQRKVEIPSGSCSLETQQAWTARYVPLMLAKPSVHGIFWNQLRDSLPHDVPNAGLFGEKGQTKPALKTLASIRASCLASR